MQTARKEEAPSGAYETRLKWLLREKGVRNQALCDALGRSQCVVHSLLNGLGFPADWTTESQRRLTEFVEAQGIRKNGWFRPATDDEIYRGQAACAARGETHARLYVVNGKHDRRVPLPKPEAKMKKTKQDKKKKEVVIEMLSFEAIKHFKLKGDPFTNEIHSRADVFFNNENKVIKQAVLDASRHQGFIALIGEVGSGKTTILNAALEDLRGEERVTVIYPQTVAKERLTATQITEAVVRDLAPADAPRASLEARSRQIKKLLESRAADGGTAVLILEEAHAMPKTTLRQLKRFYELVQGYRKLLGIILIGQLELLDRLGDTDIREVAKRCRKIVLKGLPDNGGIRAYLQYKFSRVGAKVDDVFENDAWSTLGRFRWSQNPLDLNNYTVRLMNQAAEAGEKKISRDLVFSVLKHEDKKGGVTDGDE